MGIEGRTVGIETVSTLDVPRSSRGSPAGRHAMVWNGMDAGGRRAPSGIYFVRLLAGDLDTARKMVLLQ